MPTYQYACTDCAERLEVVQKFSDDPLTLCSSCGGRLRKVFSPVGIVFKGSGFYRNDSRKGSEPAMASANGSDSKKSDAAASAGSSAGSSGDKSGTSDKKAGEKVSAGSSSSGSTTSASSSSGSKVA